MALPIDTPYEPVLARRICELVIAGKTLNTIEKELDIQRQMIYRWMRDNPLFTGEYRHARTEGAHALVDEAIDAADDPTMDPQRARNRMQARQWAAERRNRKDYGQQMDLNVNQVTDIRGTMIEARKRTVLPACDLAQIPQAQDVEYVELPAGETTDKESAGVKPAVNPFD